MDTLKNEIAKADSFFEDALEVEEAIEKLSGYKTTTSILLDELRRLTIKAEELWRQIEQREDFKTKFTNRIQAREYFDTH